MKVIVSKVMAKTLQKYCKDYQISYCETTPHAYRMRVDCFNDHENDYLIDKDRMKFIQVNYPSEHYALPKYITTDDLVRIWNRTEEKTLDDFVKAFKREIEI